MPKLKTTNLIWPRQTWLWPIVVLLIALSAFYFKPWQTKTTETISVAAQGKAQVTPNVAKITAAIATQNPNLDAARDENNQKVAKIVDQLKTLGVDAKDIKTQNISGGPSYQIQIYPRPPRPNTNQFETSLEITIHNFDKADSVIASLTQNGATNLYGPNLTIDDTALEQAKSKAREDAVSQASKKAQDLAKLSKRKLGKVVNIKEQGDFQTPVPLLAQSSVDLKEKVAQIQPGQDEVTINLLVDFLLK